MSDDIKYPWIYAADFVRSYGPKSKVKGINHNLPLMTQVDAWNLIKMMAQIYEVEERVMAERLADVHIERYGRMEKL
jgi:hypothetical protein